MDPVMADCLQILFRRIWLGVACVLVGSVVFFILLIANLGITVVVASVVKFLLVVVGLKFLLSAVKAVASRSVAVLSSDVP